HNPPANHISPLSLHDALPISPGELLWIDPFTDKIVRRMPIGPAPNQLAVTPDGKFAYIPVNDGYYEVVDLAKAQILTRIFTGGRDRKSTRLNSSHLGISYAVF